MDITGKVIKVLPMETIERDVNGEHKVYYVQYTIIEINDGRYTKNVCLRAFGQDAINKCQSQVGETVTVSFDISSRSFTDKNGKERWSTELNMWRLQHGQAQQAYAPQQGYAPMQQQYAPQAPQYAPQPQTQFPPQQPAYQQPAFQPQQPQMPFPPQMPNPNDDRPF